jgi:hypothetical protein
MLGAPELGSGEVLELPLLPQPNMTLTPEAATRKGQNFDRPEKLA